MSISSTANRVVYTGNGSTTAFSFPYEFFATTDLVVLETVIATGIVTIKTLVTGYTVSGTPDASGIYPNGGTVTALVAPASTVKWTIYRDVPATQTTVFVDNNKLSAASLNNALDKLTLLAQRTREIVLRCVRLDDGDVSGAATTLPAPVASKLLGWASDGLSLVNYAIADLSSSIVTSFSASLLLLANAAAWRAALGVPQGMHSQVFIGSGTFTTPAGTLSTTQFKFIVTGGGAGGGGAAATGGSGGGGGAGATAIYYVSGLAASQACTVTVGAGGGGGAAGNTNGSAGADSLIVVGAVTVTAAGGGSGQSSGTTNAPYGGSGGGASNGTLNIFGGDGASGTPFLATSLPTGGSGAGSFWGGGGSGGPAGNAATAGRAWGSGGGGGGPTAASNAAGGDGKMGVVVVGWVL